GSSLPSGASVRRGVLSELTDRQRPASFGNKEVLKTRAVTAELFSSSTDVPAGADQASPALFTLSSDPILYVTSPARVILAAKPAKASRVRQPGSKSRACCTICVSAESTDKGKLAACTIVGSNGESCTAVVCGAPSGKRKLVRRRALPDPVLPAA